MRVACVHYHLRRGGVTRVIANAVAGLGDAADTVVLAGGPCAGDAPGKTAVVAGLGYTETFDAAAARALAAELRRAAKQALGGEPDLWHVHNHCLGKNVLLPAALHHLLEGGARLLLQIHDFAEDGRPANHKAQRLACGDAGTHALQLYPVAPQVHYATLNSRDDAVLAAAGIQDERRHLLPNAVFVPGGLKAEGEGGEVPVPQPYLLYPTRAIRRKNIGELLLLAALAMRRSQRLTFATTLAPENPVWRETYDEWVGFASAQRLPARFGVGERPDVSFASLVRGAQALLTTSVGEGFGLAFLEPFLFGKDIVGRDLPDITADFTREGIDLGNLYPRLPVRLSDTEQGLLRSALERALPAAYQAYGQPLPRGALERALDGARAGDGFDFGRLDEPLQRAVIGRLVAGADPDTVAPAAPGFSARGGDVVARNRDVVNSHYSIAAYGERLRRCYAAVLASGSGRVTAGDAGAVLARFLDPATFCLLRS